MKKGIYLLILFLLAGTGTHAETLNLEQTRALAVTNSRSLAQHSLSLRNSILNERSHLYTMLPSLSANFNVSMDYLKGNWEPVNPIDTFETGLNFGLTQRILTGGSNFVQKAINAITTESARKAALAEYFNVLDSADNAYYAVLESAAALEAEESSLRNALAGLAIAEIRQANGMINMGDYLRAMAEKESRENSRNQARRTLALNMTKLKALIGLGESFELEQIDFSAYEELTQFFAGISDEQADALYEKFWRVLATANPSLVNAALNSQVAEKNLSIAKRNYFPTINATIFSTSIGYSTANGFGPTARGGISITGTIPIDFWVMTASLEKSKNARDSAALNYISARISLETELQSSLLSAFTQAGSILSTRRSLDYAEKHFEFTMERYRLSQSSVSDLGEASTLLINSRNNHIRAQYGFLQSISKLRSLGAIDNEERLMQLLMNSEE